MKRRPPRPTRTDTLVAYTTRFRSWGRPGVLRRLVSFAAFAFGRAAPTPVDTAAWRPYGRSRLPSHLRRFPNAGRRLPLPERCRGCLGEGVVGASPRPRLPGLAEYRRPGGCRLRAGLEGAGGVSQAVPEPVGDLLGGAGRRPPLPRPGAAARAAHPAPGRPVDGPCHGRVVPAAGAAD